VKSLITLVAVLAVSGCSSTSSQLETRVGALERELAAMRAAAPPSERKVDVIERSPCAQVLDASVPSDTGFPFVVQYDAAPPDTRAGDAISITEVRGTSPGLTVGGMYLVRGTYTLASAPDATLGFFVTATRRGEGCTNDNGRARQKITRGSGSFELATRVAYDGRPHVSFYVAGQGSGGVYFAGRPASAAP
jgi:hypothetical protein